MPHDMTFTPKTGPTTHGALA